MKKIFFFFAAVAICSTSNALTQSKCNLNKLADYGLFVTQESSVQYSDVEGMTGTLTSLTAVNFALGAKLSKLCPSLVINNSFYGSSGHAYNFVAAPNKAVDISVEKNPYPNFSLGAVKTYPTLNLNLVSSQLTDLSTSLAQLDTKTVSARQNDQQLQLSVNGSALVNTVNLGNLSAIENKTLSISGKADQVLILNFYANTVSLKKINLVVNGLKIKNIIWNFVNATDLQMANIGGSNSNYVDTQDGSLGLQGYILAPKATTQAEEMKITGALYTSALVSLTQKATAQINLPPDQDYENPCMDINNPKCDVAHPTPAPTPKPQ